MDRVRLLIFLVSAAFVSTAGATIADTCIDKIATGSGAKIDRAPVAGLAEGIHRAMSSNAHALLIDYSKRSQTKRAYLLDFNKCTIVAKEYVIHGGSTYDPD